MADPNFENMDPMLAEHLSLLDYKEEKVEPEDFGYPPVPTLEENEIQMREYKISLQKMIEEKAQFRKGLSIGFFPKRTTKEQVLELFDKDKVEEIIMLTPKRTLAYVYFKSISDLKIAKKKKYTFGNTQLVTSYL